MAAKLLTRLALSDQSDGRYLVTGESPEPNNTYMRLHFYQNGVDKGRTIIRVADHHAASLLGPVVLERGVYEVTVEKCLDNVSKNKWTGEEPYGTRIMAGERYHVTAVLKPAVSLNRRGMRIQVTSDELPLGDHDLYYRIRKPNPVITRVRYWIPMKNNTFMEFFVQNVSPGEIEIPERQNDILSVTVLIQGGCGNGF